MGPGNWPFLCCENGIYCSGIKDFNSAKLNLNDTIITFFVFVSAALAQRFHTVLWLTSVSFPSVSLYTK